MSVLSDEEARVLANMAGLLDNEEAKKRIADIRAAAAEHDKALSRLKVKQAEIEQLTREANQKISDAATMAANAEARHRELNQREATMREVSDALNAEKARWEAVRQQVGAQQQANAETLRNERGALDAQKKETADLMARNKERAAELDAKQERLDTAIERLTAAIRGLKA